jgi:hypothetical protein
MRVCHSSAAGEKPAARPALLARAERLVVPTAGGAERLVA